MNIAKSAIYKIEHVNSGKCYVGSTGSLSKRWSQHRKSLEAGTHHSKRLQNAWTKYGGMAFVFYVIENVEDVSDLIHREQFWIDTLQSHKNGYNISPTAGSPRGVKHTAETREKVSLAGKGRKLSEEHRAGISKRAKA